MPITKIFNFFKKWGFSYFVFETHSLKGIGGYFAIIPPLKIPLTPQDRFL
ncbi:hypothetical protein HMPREF1408_00722 [Helicobacter pylori GAM245Ai]|nr:hypothetical protein HMPREF1408_00722 [Helicobacter pylori GAM245Ai]